MEMDHSQSSSSSFKVFLKGIESRSEDAQQRKEILDNLRTAMSGFSRAELLKEMEGMSLEVLFEWLASDDEEEITSVCGILKSLMQVLDPSEILEKYHDSILQGLQHPRASVRTLVLAELQHCTEFSRESVQVLCTEYQDLIIASINQIASDDLKVYRAAELFLVSLVQTPNGSNFLLGVAGIQSFKTIINSPRTKETIKFRMYETLCKFANVSAENLSRIEDHHLLVNPLADIIFPSEDPDPLEQMNGLEILSILAESKHGVDHLENTGMLKRIQRNAIAWKEDPILTNLLYPAASKFLEKVELTKAPPPPEEFIAALTKQIQPILHL